MEYVHQRGEFADVPIDAIAATFRREYPRLVASDDEGDFERDVARET